MARLPTNHSSRRALRGPWALRVLAVVFIGLGLGSGCDDGTNGQTIPEFCQDLADRVNAEGAKCSTPYSIDPSACHFDSLAEHHCIDDCLADGDICQEECIFGCRASQL